MTFSFPLYDTLNTSEIKDLPELSQEDKEQFISLVEKLNIEGQERLYILIKKHQLDTDTQPTRLPYNSKKTKQNIKFDITELPIPLSNILYKFLKMHMKIVS